MQYWLVKTEPNTYSIDDLKSDKVTLWDKVRNYQARNNLRSMEKGDQILVYHSVVDPVGIVGLAQVAKKAYPDPTQFDKKSEYYDAGSTKENPRWYSPDIKFVKKLKATISLTDLKKEAKLKGMQLLQKGSRLSVQPVSKAEFETVQKIYNKQTGDLF